MNMYIYWNYKLFCPLSVFEFFLSPSLTPPSLPPSVDRPLLENDDLGMIPEDTIYDKVKSQDEVSKNT